MTLNRSILVVASVADTFDDWAELAAALKAHVGAEPASFRLIVPATASAGAREAASGHLSDVLAGLQESGLAADGCVGHSDPMTAVQEAWDPSQYDEIIISTLSERSLEVAPHCAPRARRQADWRPCHASRLGACKAADRGGPATGRRAPAPSSAIAAGPAVGSGVG